MTIMQVGIVACLGGEEGTGEKCGEAAERFAGNSSLSEGLFTCKGKRIISRILTHGESVTNRTGSTRQRNRLWNHLIWSWEQKDTIAFLPGTYL